MKKVLITLIAVVFTFGLAGAAEAAVISFADTIIGVDSPAPAGWSTNNSLKKINSSYTLLNGMATVSGYKNGSYALSHRLTRGLGVWSGEFDEVDFKSDRPERIEITFDVVDYYVNSLEVRSLFKQGGVDSWGTEKGTIDFWLDGSSFYTENLVGQMSGGNGALVVSYGTPKLVDKLVYYIPTGMGIVSRESEFAVAKLDVTATPEPTSLLLFGIGGLGLGFFKRKRRGVNK